MKQLFIAILLTSPTYAMEADTVILEDGQVSSIPSVPETELLPSEDNPPEPIPLAQSKEAQESRFFVTNHTSEPALLKYTVDKTSLKRVVRAHTTLYICAPVLLSSVTIFPHGWLKGTVNIESITGGVAKQPEQAGKILASVIKETPVDIFLDIILPQGISGTFSSFNLLISSERKNANYKLPATLEEALPYVSKLASGEKGLLSSITNGTVDPRHILSVPDDASEESIITAYKAIKHIWQDRVDPLGTVINQLTDTSYAILVDRIRLREKEAAFQQLVALHLGPRKNIITLDDNEEN